MSPHIYGQVSLIQNNTLSPRKGQRFGMTEWLQDLHGNIEISLDILRCMPPFADECRSFAILRFLHQDANRHPPFLATEREYMEMGKTDAGDCVCITSVTFELGLVAKRVAFIVRSARRDWFVRSVLLKCTF
jgi:hypothetical protein